MVSRKDAQWIFNAIDLAAAACEQISEADACDECPLRGTCLYDDRECFIDVATSFTVSDWADFLALSDDAVGRQAGNEADYADMMRKMEQEERMIDETYGF